MKAVTYCRLSPRPKESDSIAHQRDRCRAYCLAMGYDVVGEFDDPRASGRSMEGRPGLEAALRCACRNRAVLVVYSITRLSRDGVDSQVILRVLQKGGAELAALDMRVDTTTPYGRFAFGVAALAGQMERELTSERTSAALLWKQSQGKRIGGKCVYGMRVDEGDVTRIVASEDEQAVIHSMVRLRESGMSFRAIADHLNGFGVGAREGRWHGEVVRRILKREIGRGAKIEGV